MEDQEPLETSALVSELPDPVQHQVHYLLAYSVVPPGMTVSSVPHSTDVIAQIFIIVSSQLQAVPGVEDGGKSSHLPGG